MKGPGRGRAGCGGAAATGSSPPTLRAADRADSPPRLALGGNSLRVCLPGPIRGQAQAPRGTAPTRCRDRACAHQSGAAADPRGEHRLAAAVAWPASRLFAAGPEPVWCNQSHRRERRARSGALGGSDVTLRPSDKDGAARNSLDLGCGVRAAEQVGISRTMRFPDRSQSPVLRVRAGAGCAGRQ